jgi:hypothetical protein
MYFSARTTPVVQQLDELDQAAAATTANNSYGKTPEG